MDSAEKTLPWEGEGDYHQFIHDDYLGVLVRHPELKVWCGYVGVPQEKIDQIPELIKPFLLGQQGMDLINSQVKVHDYVTYYKDQEPYGFRMPTPSSILSGDVPPVPRWWVGFSCSAEDDGIPWDVENRYEAYKNAGVKEGEKIPEDRLSYVDFCFENHRDIINKYWTKEKVIEELKGLIAQVNKFLYNSKDLKEEQFNDSP